MGYLTRSADGGCLPWFNESGVLTRRWEFTPDGQRIYVNSSRSGRMQIWGMQPGGHDPEQVTDDAFNNWLPHVAPDGRSMVFLTFASEVAPDGDPFYQQVYLRQGPTSGGPPRVVAYI